MQTIYIHKNFKILKNTSRSITLFFKLLSSLPKEKIEKIEVYNPRLKEMLNLQGKMSDCSFYLEDIMYNTITVQGDRVQYLSKIKSHKDKTIFFFNSHAEKYIYNLKTDYIKIDIDIIDKLHGKNQKKLYLLMKKFAGFLEEKELTRKYLLDWFNYLDDGDELINMYKLTQRLKNAGKAISERTDISIQIETKKKYKKTQSLIFKIEEQEKQEVITSQKLTQKEASNLNKYKPEQEDPNKTEEQKKDNKIPIFKEQKENQIQVVLKEKLKNQIKKRKKKKEILHDHEKLELHELREFYNRIFKKKIRSIKGLENNFIYWREEYEIDQIKMAIANASLDKWWKDKFTLEILLRRKNPNGEQVNRIEEFSNKFNKEQIKEIQEEGNGNIGIEPMPQEEDYDNANIYADAKRNYLRAYYSQKEVQDFVKNLSKEQKNWLDRVDRYNKAKSKENHQEDIIDSNTRTFSENFNFIKRM